VRLVDGRAAFVEEIVLFTGGTAALFGIRLADSQTARSAILSWKDADHSPRRHSPSAARRCQITEFDLSRPIC